MTRPTKRLLAQAEQRMNLTTGTKSPEQAAAKAIRWGLSGKSAATMPVRDMLEEELL